MCVEGTISKKRYGGEAGGGGGVAGYTITAAVTVEGILVAGCSSARVCDPMGC
jgi:hypothetical protein